MSVYDPGGPARARAWRAKMKARATAADNGGGLPLEPATLPLPAPSPAFNGASAAAEESEPAPLPAGRPLSADWFCSWASERLIVPAGLRQGRRFKVFDWQREFIRGALQPGIREAGLSIARKNGKTGLVAALLLWMLCEVRRPQWRAIVVSLSGEVAKELRNQAEGMIEASGLRGLQIRRSPSPGGIVGPDGMVSILNAEKSSGHAVGADLAIVDEAGLLEERRRDLWDSVRSCISGRDGRMLAMSIRGNGPMFEELRQRRDDRAVFWMEFSAPEDADITSPDTWRAANPGLADGIKSMDYMADRARFALRSPGDQSRFRGFDLNMRIAPEVSSIVSVTDWRACTVDTADALPAATGPCYVGIDIGGAASLSAIVAYWPASGRVESLSAAAGSPDAAERGRADGVGDTYVRAVADGSMLLTPGRTTDVSRLIGEAWDRFLAGAAVRVIGADRYRQSELRDALDESGIPRVALEWRGTGAGKTAQGSADVRAFQRAVMDNRLSVVTSDLWTLAVGESELRYDGAGNPALDKSRFRARIDLVQAAVIACGMAAQDAAMRRGGDRRGRGVAFPTAVIAR